MPGPNDNTAIQVGNQITSCGCSLFIIMFFSFIAIAALVVVWAVLTADYPAQ